MSFKNLAKLVKQATEEQSPAQDFLNMFNQATSRLDEQRQPSKTFKPSSLGGCIRKVYFEVTGAPIDANPDINPDMVGVGQSGTDRHERMQTTITHMKELGYDVEWIDVAEYLKIRPQMGTEVVERKGMETKLRNTVLNLSFMCDGIIKFKGKYYILEIKTEASFKYMKRFDVEPDHLVQGTSYSTALGINLILFIYENRDLCQKKTFVVEITDEDKQDKVIHTIETVNDHIEREVVPEKSTVKKHCTYCQFKGECKKW